MIDKLRELSELAPDICHPYGDDAYDIGPYRFSFLSDGTLQASTGAAVEEGRPALAWLRDALEAVIEARGWRWRVGSGEGDYYAAEVLPPVQYGHGPNPAEALLDALLGMLNE